jgi:hypothetical protein
MDFSHVTADKREALYNEVWSDPVITVAKRYGMSDNGLRKHCKKLGIPLPPAGYWVKLKAGKQVSRPALPKVTGEVRNHVRNYFIKYKTDIDKLTDAELAAASDELSLLSEETKAQIREICSQLQVKDQLRNPHHLIIEHQAEIVNRKKRDTELKRASLISNYQVNWAGVHRNYNKPVLPITVSQSNLNRAYRILDTTMSTLEEMEGHTRVNTIYEGKDEACFHVFWSDFNFEIKEDARKKESSKNNGESQPCLVLSMSVKRWFTNNEQLKLEYKDKDNEPLETHIGKIIYDMFVIANKHRVSEELREREQKRAWEEQDRQRRLEQMRKGELEEVRLLEQASSDWYKAEMIRKFADCLEGKINEVATEDKRDKLLRWLKWAREKADWLDPLTAKEDKLLGKSKHIFELIKDEDI